MNYLLIITLTACFFNTSLQLECMQNKTELDNTIYLYQGGMPTKSVSFKAPEKETLEISEENKKLLKKIALVDRVEEIECTPWEKKDPSVTNLFNFDERVWKYVTYANLDNKNLSEAGIHHLISVEYLIESLLNSTVYLTLSTQDEKEIPRLTFVSRIKNMRDDHSLISRTDGFVTLTFGQKNVLFHCSFQPYPPSKHYISKEIIPKIFINETGNLCFFIKPEAFNKTLAKLKELKNKALQQPNIEDLQNKMNKLKVLGNNNNKNKRDY